MMMSVPLDPVHIILYGRVAETKCDAYKKHVHHSDDSHDTLLFKGCDLAATAGLRDTTARLGNPGTLCTLPTFTQPSHELHLCLS